jgi:transcriptional regulator with PAS, ATPase and Fis domain
MRRNKRANKAKRAMTPVRWLVAWIGGTDHEASEGRLKGDSGPIAAALLSGEKFDRVYLLTNYAHERSVAYCDWLARKTGIRSKVIALHSIDLRSPVDYDAIYAEVSKSLAGANLPRDDVQLTFHLSPGTPAMTVIWIVLARTRFPARLIQTTRSQGIHEVTFFTDVADAFLPEYLQRGDQRIETLAAGPKDSAPEFSAIVHSSGALERQIELARRMAAYDVPILILGETGTGKELFAEAIHKASRRANGPFVPVNCGAVAPELANSELFGHAKGSFTGAVRDHRGYFESADGGTLFLDEIGDLPLDTQVRLLRVLQSKTVTRLGGTKPTPVDVRIVAATHRDLAANVSTGQFREDLFHRLAVGILTLPPLREREADIAILGDHFMTQINSEGAGKPEAQSKHLSKDAKNLLLKHSWPGNVRELYHTLLRAALWSRGPVIEAVDISAALLPAPAAAHSPLKRPLAQGFDLEAFLDDIKTHYIRLAMERCGGRKTAAARLLGFSNHQTLGNWMRRLGLEDEASD